MPRNHWVRRAIVGWSVFVGGFGAWGWTEIIGGTVGLICAMVSVAACVVLLNVSAQLLRAERAGRGRSVTLFGTALLLFGVWSGLSAHLAFEHAIQGADMAALPPYAAPLMILFFFGSSVIDPLLMWGVEDVERGDSGAPGASGDAVVDLPEPAPHPALRLVAGATAAAALAVAPTAAVAMEQPSARHAAPEAGSDARVAQALRLRSQGMTRAEVAIEMGVSESTITRLWRQARTSDDRSQIMRMACA